MSIIGKVTLPTGVVVSLTEQGKWVSDDSTVAATFNDQFNPANMRGVAAVMPFGVQAVNQAAVQSKGKAEVFVKIPPDNEWTLY